MEILDFEKINFNLKKTLFIYIYTRKIKYKIFAITIF